MDLEVRALRPGEQEAFVRSVHVPFLDPAPLQPDAAAAERLQRTAGSIEVDRAWVAETDGRFVANACIFSMDVTLPAAPGQDSPIVPFAGVSAVGVHPTHPRRGLLRQLMARMLEDARQRQEVLAGLIASESIIYGRFGYGHATSAASWHIDTQRSAFRVPVRELDIRLIDPTEAASALPALYERQRRGRAGETNRSEGTWRGYLEDPPDHRRGGGGLFYAVCDDGYAAYRATDADILRAQRGRVIVEEVRAISPEVEAALWRFVFDLDLVGEASARRRPIDEALRWYLADPRQLRIDNLDDRLWVRILDVPGALEARGYRREGRLVLDVAPPPDQLDAQPDPVPGRWVLEAGPDGASCRSARPGESADIRLGVADLGSLYFGGFSASELAAGGRVEELRSGSLDVADALLATRPAPLTVTGF
jgi:predicted acetyltransferase